MTEQVSILEWVKEPYLPSAVSDTWTSAEFRPKADRDYVAVIKSAIQRRSRAHKTLVRVAGKLLNKAGAAVTTPHPRDLLISIPVQLIVEAKDTWLEAPWFRNIEMLLGSYWSIDTFSVHTTPITEVFVCL